MRLRIGFDFTIVSEIATPTAAIVRPRDSDAHALIDERLTIEPALDLHRYQDSFGNLVWRWLAPAGTMTMRYDAIADRDRLPDEVLADLPGTPVSELPDEAIVYTLPSRYCPSDMVIGDAWNLFGATPDGWARVQAICDWAHANIAYGYGNSISTTSGYDAYLNRAGVCRDFAHIGVMFCRALNIPARYVYGYLPDIDVPYNPTPMDFHAWFEAYVGGAWRTFDARHNQPRVGRVVIARGRDAVDTAIMTSYGNSRLTGFTVWADEVNDALTLDTPLP